MEKQIQEIHQTLQKLIGLHRQLMDIVRLEREALIEANIKAIQDVTVAKQGLIEAIAQTEAQRLMILGSLAIAWKIPTRELSLPKIIIRVQGDDLKSADQLRSSFNALTILIQRITEQNKDNQALVEKSLAHVAEMKRNVLGEAMPKTSTYTQQGQKNTASTEGRLISREA